MFKVKKKNNPVFVYTVLSVQYIHGKIMFLIYDHEEKFVLMPASDFKLLNKWEAVNED